MDIDMIKQVPEILENPVIIMKSITHDDSIVIFGDVKAKNGDPIMAALQLTPKPGGNAEAEFSLVTSAYGRSDTNIFNLLKNSEWMYLDPNKNRTNNWLMHLRVQFPSGQPPFGSIGNISYADTGVKITGKTLQALGVTIEQKKKTDPHSEWDAGISDRELLLEAAEQEGAPKAVTDYAKKVRRVAALERQEARLRQRTESPSSVGSADS